MWFCVERKKHKDYPELLLEIWGIACLDWTEHSINSINPKEVDGLVYPDVDSIGLRQAFLSGMYRIRGRSNSSLGMAEEIMRCVKEEDWEPLEYKRKMIVLKILDFKGKSKAKGRPGSRDWFDYQENWEDISVFKLNIDIFREVREGMKEILSKEMLGNKEKT